MESWILRDEIIKIINKWYLALIIILIGAVVGFLSSYIIPAPYRATVDLYVGIDVTRVNEMEYLIPLASTEPLNLDDYKNWQLKQLSDILYLDIVLRDTLDTLKETDPSWREVTLSDFKKTIDIYWYDTGIWRLEVENRDRSMAEMAAKTWLDTGYGKISDLLSYAEIAAALDSDLQIIKGASSIQKARIARIKAFMDSSQNLSAELDLLTRNETLPDDVFDDMQQWILVYLTPSDMWQVPLGGFPGKGQLVSSYASWLDRAQVNAATALEESQKQFEILIGDRDQEFCQIIIRL